MLLLVGTLWVQVPLDSIVEFPYSTKKWGVPLLVPLPAQYQNIIANGILAPTDGHYILSETQCISDHTLRQIRQI